MANLNQFDMAFSVAYPLATAGQFCPDAPVDVSYDARAQRSIRQVHALSSIKPHVLALAILASSGLWCVLGWAVYQAAMLWGR